MDKGVQEMSEKEPKVTKHPRPAHPWLKLADEFLVSPRLQGAVEVSELQRWLRWHTEIAKAFADIVPRWIRIHKNLALSYLDRGHWAAPDDLTKREIPPTAIGTMMQEEAKKETDELMRVALAAKLAAGDLAIKRLIGLLETSSGAMTQILECHKEIVKVLKAKDDEHKPVWGRCSLNEETAKEAAAILEEERCSKTPIEDKFNEKMGKPYAIRIAEHRNRKGSLCGLCDGTHYHTHAQVRCSRCCKEGLEENWPFNCCRA
jgi:hypothetical protein